MKPATKSGYVVIDVSELTPVSSKYFWPASIISGVISISGAPASKSQEAAVIPRVGIVVSTG